MAASRAVRGARLGAAAPAARGGHSDQRLLVIAGSLTWQLLQGGPLGLNALGAVDILAADDLVDQAAVAGKVEVADAAHQQGVPYRIS